MAIKKPIVKEIKHVRGIEFSCPKSLKMLRGSITKQQFRILILNQKQFEAKKKSKKAD